MSAPDTERLLAGLQRGIATAASEPTALPSAEVALRWLHHTEAGAFHAEHYAKGHALLQEGVELVGGQDSFPDSLPESADAELRSDQHTQLRAELMEAIEQTIDTLVANGDDPGDYLDRVERWERDYYAHLSAPLPPDTSAEAAPLLDAATIQSYLRRALDGTGEVTVTEAKILTGGYGRATVLVTTDAPVFGDRELVVRAELPVTILELKGLDITTEFHVIRLAHKAGIAAPEPLLLDAGENEIGARFILMRKARGSNYGSAFAAEREISDALVDNLVKGLAEIHKVDVTRFPDEVANSHLRDWVKDETMTESVRRWVETWHAYWRSTGVASPLLTRAFRWLFDNVPESDAPPQLMHSDFALGNLLVEDNEITAVLDWEATHLGDPAEEVAWLVNSLRDHVPESAIVDRYAELTGTRFEAERLRYFDVLTVVKMVACGFGAMARFSENPAAGPQFCLLASHILEPYCLAVQVAIQDRTGPRPVVTQKRTSQ